MATNATAWSTELQRSGAHAARRCAQHRKRAAPLTAFCIAGAARSFAAPLVQSSLRHHLVGAFGGAVGSRVFFLLKSDDNAKRHEPIGIAQIRYAARSVPLEPLEAALRDWADWIGEAAIVRGSGSAPLHSGEAGVSVLQGNASAWRGYRSALAHKNASGSHATR